MILYFIFKLVLSFIFSLPSSVKTTLTEDDLDGRHINAGLVMFWVTALAGFFFIENRKFCFVILNHFCHLGYLI